MSTYKQVSASVEKGVSIPRMSDQEVDMFYESFRKKVKPEDITTDKYVSICVREGSLADAVVGDLPLKGSGYFPIGRSSQTTKFFDIKGKRYFTERVRLALLDGFAYDLNLDQDFAVTLLRRTYPKVVLRIEEVIGNIKKGSSKFKDFKPYDMNSIELIKWDDLHESVIKRRKIDTREIGYAEWFERVSDTELENVYLTIKEQGLDNYISEAQIGTSEVEFDDFILNSLGYINQMLYALDAIERHTTSRRRRR